MIQSRADVRRSVDDVTFEWMNGRCDGMNGRRGWMNSSQFERTRCNVRLSHGDAVTSWSSSATVFQMKGIVRARERLAGLTE